MEVAVPQINNIKKASLSSTIVVYLPRAGCTYRGRLGDEGPKAVHPASHPPKADTLATIEGGSDKLYRVFARLAKWAVFTEEEEKGLPHPPCTHTHTLLRRVTVRTSVWTRPESHDDHEAPPDAGAGLRGLLHARVELREVPGRRRRRGRLGRRRRWRRRRRRS